MNVLFLSTDWNNILVRECKLLFLSTKSQKLVHIICYLSIGSFFSHVWRWNNHSLICIRIRNIKRVVFVICYIKLQKPELYFITYNDLILKCVTVCLLHTKLIGDRRLEIHKYFPEVNLSMNVGFDSECERIDDAIRYYTYWLSSPLYLLPRKGCFILIASHIVTKCLQ